VRADNERKDELALEHVQVK